MTTPKLTVDVRVRLRRTWLVKLAAWLLRFASVEVNADGKHLSPPMRFTLSNEVLDKTEDVA